MTPQSVTHIANGASVAFAFPFAVFEPGDIEVLVNGAVQSTGFALVGLGSSDSGAVRFDSAPADGTAVIIRRTGRAQVSSSDAPGFLEDKIVAGDQITITKTFDAAGEHLSIATDIDPNQFQPRDAELDWLAANLTNAGKALAGGADAAAQRSALGLAAVANSGSYNDLSNKPVLGSVAALDVDTDGTLAANSDGRIAGQKAVKTYVDGKIAVAAGDITALQQDVAQLFLSTAINSALVAGSYANGGYDAFNTDTIGANSSSHSYDAVNKLYANYGTGYSSNLLNDGTPIESGHFGSQSAAYAFDGNASSYWAGAIYNTAGVNWVGYQLAAPLALTKIAVYVSSGIQAYDQIFDLQYSDNGSSWTSASTNISVPVDTWVQHTFTAVGSHAYWRLLSQDNSVVYPGVCEFQGFANQSPSNMTLVSNALTTLAPVSTVMAEVLWKAIDASTLNVDLTLELSADGGTNWTTATLSDTGAEVSGFKVLWASASGLTTGTNVKYRLKTHNTKQQQIKGVAYLAK